MSSLLTKEQIMKTKSIEVIGNTLQKISDMVTPTMGPRGMNAVLADEFSRPYITDDGVTVTRECLNFDDPFEKMVAMSVAEAAGNTEKSAFDGTTLTVLLVNELYKTGMKLIKDGMHPQLAADAVQEAVKDAGNQLAKQRIKLNKDNTSKLIKDVSYITTKIKFVGDLVFEAYKKAGENMNVVIEHDRINETSSIEYVDGMVVDSGYFSPEFSKSTDEDGVWRRNNAKLFFLSEGILTVNGLKGLLGSIPNKNTPLVFVLDRNFSPDTLKGLVENLSANELDFMFIFINDPKSDEVYLDMAAKTDGKIQSATYNTTDYLYEYAGTADHIEIDQKKSKIITKGNPEEVKRRLDAYKKELKDNRYTTGYTRADVINRRMGNLGSGMTKIKIATPSITEYRTIRFKLDDAIGAVRCALREGVVLGGGYALEHVHNVAIKEALESPVKTILTNAGYKYDQNQTRRVGYGIDARTGKEVDLFETGIIDSYSSIASALKNAGSIACSYLRAYILINQNAKPE